MTTPRKVNLRKLRKLWDTDMTVAEIADYFDCSTSAVSRNAGRLGLPRKNRRPVWEYAERNYGKPRSDHEAKVRPCMTCEKEFRSQHIGHRMCDDCRRSTYGLI